jgi:hypothetical protein
MVEKRHFTRLNSPFDAIIKIENQVYHGHLIDLSLKGALVELSHQIKPLGINCLITIPLAASGLKMSFNAKLVHSEDHHFGFKFESEDLDSLIHLRRFLELNCADPEQITHELFFLVKQD